MKSLTMLDFRKQAEAVLEKVQKGQRFVLTYRGKPVARLEPIEREMADDPIYQLADLASDEAAALTNREIDRVVYGE